MNVHVAEVTIVQLVVNYQAKVTNVAVLWFLLIVLVAEMAKGVSKQWYLRLLSQALCRRKYFLASWGSGASYNGRDQYFPGAGLRKIEALKSS